MMVMQPEKWSMAKVSGLWIPAVKTGLHLLEPERHSRVVGMVVTGLDSLVVQGDT